MDNWEDRLQALPIQTAQPWEVRLRSADYSAAPNPAGDPSTLQVFNPFGQNFDTGIPLSVNAQNYLAGAGKALTDLAKGAAQKVGAYSFDDAKETKRLDDALMKTRAGLWGNVTGNVAAALPASLIPGAGTLAGGSAIGAALGALQPATGLGDMVANTGMGAGGGFGGALLGKGLAAGYGLAKSTFQPFFQGGRQQIAADILREFTPNPQQTLANIAGDAGEIVPGSLPTAAEAAQTPGISQLTKQVQQTPGAAQEAFLARQQANNAARVAAIRDIAGDPGQRAFFAANRDATADQLYGAARSAGIDPAALTLEAQANIAAFQARLPSSVVNEARSIAKMTGTPMTDATSIDGMHWIKMALDGLISKEAGPGGNSALLRAYTGLKNDLVTGMDALSPDYAAARQSFADMSKPINQMDIGQALSDKLIPALNDFGATGNLRAAGYAEALRHGDITAQRALGFPSATMADVLEPSQMDTLNAIGRDLARSQNANSLAKAAGSDTVQNAVSQNIIRNTLGPFGGSPALAHNTLLASLLRPAQYAGSLAEPQIMDALGTALLSPQATAKLLATQPTGASALSNVLLRYSAPLGAVYGLPNLAQQ